MHLENVIATTGKVVTSTFVDNAAIKFVFGGAAGLLGTIVDGNDKIIAAVFILYLVDLVTGTIKAMKRRELQSGKFFTGATKLLVYGIFLLIAGSIDEAIGAGNVARWVMFVFIITTDGLSILENLEALGVNTPIFLKKYLHAAQAKAEGKLDE